MLKPEPGLARCGSRTQAEQDRGKWRARTSMVSRAPSDHHCGHPGRTKERPATGSGARPPEPLRAPLRGGPPAAVVLAESASRPLSDTLRVPFVERV